jgi:hypothetical protein
LSCPLSALTDAMNPDGKSTVLTWTRPPLKSPGRSGVAVLATTVFSIIDAGIRSKEKLFLSASVSVLVTATPLSVVEL